MMQLFRSLRTPSHPVILDDLFLHGTGDEVVVHRGAGRRTGRLPLGRVHGSFSNVRRNRARGVLAWRNLFRLFIGLLGSILISQEVEKRAVLSKSIQVVSPASSS